MVPAIEKARLYRGKGGEVMRAAVCLLIRNTARVGLPLTPALKKALHASIDENLKHPTKTILVRAPKHPASSGALDVEARVGMSGGGAWPVAAVATCLRSG